MRSRPRQQLARCGPTGRPQDIPRGRRGAGAGLSATCLGLLVVWGGMVAAPDPVRSQQAVEQEMAHAAASPAVVIARPGPTAALDLATCVELAWQGNEALLAEKTRRQELGGQRLQAVSTGLPSIDLTGTWLRSRDPSFALDESFGGGGDSFLPSPLDTLLGDISFLPTPQDVPAQTFWRTSLNLHWTLNPVQVIEAVGAANLGIQRQELAIESLQQQVTEQTVVAYHCIILAAEQLAAVGAQITNQQELLTIMQLRYELGLATQLDTLQAAVAVANLQPQRHRAEQNLRHAGSQLNALMGKPPTDPLAIRNEQEVELDLVDHERALVLALQRPDVGQVEIYADLLRRNRQAQKAEMRPYLTVDGAYGYVGKRLDEFDDEGHDFWSAAVAVNVPLFDGLLTKGQVQQTEASIRRTETELSGLRRQVQVEVLQILDELETARTNLQAARLNLTRSEDLLDQLAMMLRLGKADYLSVLEAEASRAVARSNLIEARYEVLSASAALKRALGYSPLLPLAAIDGLVAMEMP